MNSDEGQKEIRRQVVVSQQMVVIAKAIIVNRAKGSCTADELVNEVMVSNQAEMPEKVFLFEGEVSVAATARALSWRMAAIEGIWSLVHAGYLLPQADLKSYSANVQYTTIGPSGGGESSTWSIKEYELAVPSSFFRAPSTIGQANQFLTEPDLYLHSLRSPTMHSDVSASLREAVKCFRSELFTASLGMLGRASEGAWLELGASLLTLVPESDKAKYSKQRSTLEDSTTGVQKKIEAVLTVFAHQELFEPAAKEAGIKVQDLRAIAAWSDTVRDSRNTIHFGVTPATPNTYEKVAVLLLGAVPNVGSLYRLKDAVDAARQRG